MWLFQNMDIVRMVDQIIAATVIKPEWEFVLNAPPTFWQSAAEVIMGGDLIPCFVSQTRVRHRLWQGIDNLDRTQSANRSCLCTNGNGDIIK